MHRTDQHNRKLRRSMKPHKTMKDKWRINTKYLKLKKISKTVNIIKL